MSGRARNKSRDLAFFVDVNRSGEAAMSERGVAFVERWIAENVASEDFLEDGDVPRFDRLAQDALDAAGRAGLPRGEILEEFPDLALRMAEAVQGAADRELRRRIDDEA